MAKVSVADFAGIGVAVAPGAGFIFAQRIFRTGFVGAFRLAAFALVTLNHTKRNTGFGIGRTTVLTIPKTFATVKAIISGNVFGSVTALARGHRSLVA